MTIRIASVLRLGSALLALSVPALLPAGAAAQWPDQGCPTKLIAIEPDGTRVYQAVCPPPRSTQTSLTPSNYGLSPAAGSDQNKHRDIADAKLDKKLEEKEQVAHCLTPGPAAGRTYEQVLQQAHALTDKIRAATESIADWNARSDQIETEIASLDAEVWRLRHLLPVSTQLNQRIDDEGDVLTAAERARIRQDIEKLERQIKGKEAVLDFELPQAQALADEVVRLRNERDALVEDAAKRLQVNGRFCGTEPT